MAIFTESCLSYLLMAQNSIYSYNVLVLAKSRLCNVYSEFEYENI